MAAKESQASTQSVASLSDIKKHNDAIGLRPVKGNLSLISRRIFNVMIMAAQEQKKPGNFAPTKSPTDRAYYWVPLSEFTRNIEFESKNIASIKMALNNMMELRLEADSEDRWACENLLASAVVLGGNNKDNLTGQTWIGFSFPPQVSEKILNPTEYTKLSLYYQSNIRSGAALGLYEICRRFATNPSKKTYIQSLEFWYTAVTGNPFKDAVNFEYKIFKRDVLNKAIKEISDNTDIKVSLIEHKLGRKVHMLQFEVELEKQTVLPLDNTSDIDFNLVSKITELGISTPSACKILGTHKHAVVEKAISEFNTKFKELSSDGTSKIKSPTAYFRWLLKQVESRESQKKAPVPVKQAKNSVMEKFLAKRCEDALNLYELKDESDKTQEYENFIGVFSGKGFKPEKGLRVLSNRKLFGAWYAEKLWGQPSAEALAKFVEENLFI